MWQCSLRDRQNLVLGNEVNEDAACGTDSHWSPEWVSSQARGLFQKEKPGPFPLSCVLGGTKSISSKIRTRKECSFSPLLFNAVLGIFLEQLGKRKKKGNMSKKGRSQISLFADNRLVFIFRIFMWILGLFFSGSVKNVTRIWGGSALNLQTAFGDINSAVLGTWVSGILQPWAKKTKAGGVAITNYKVSDKKWHDISTEWDTEQPTEQRTKTRTHMTTTIWLSTRGPKTHMREKAPAWWMVLRKLDIHM